MMKKPTPLPRFTNPEHPEYGGTLIGFVVGLAVGLGVALLIAFYLSKNTPQERPGVRAPNLPLNIKSAPSGEGQDATSQAPLDLNKPLQGKTAAPTSDPIGDLVSGKKTVDPAPATKVDAIFFLQVGAFNKQADADAQKASLAIQGVQSQLSEITTDGNTAWRVRVGPFNSADDSKASSDKLSKMGIKTTLIKSSKS
ncbi:SPOR domain-containing protein [Polynucleobacter paneuropaeus]|uniref:SPOR domain-containing protein n=1 Tax=Polynucleobacter paneuropaeus TaxID=2527775 RepID=UPI001BFE7F40|nr:SPOR domain-containing protein [Polynucleobacter paneuropaeus]MBT8621406.1 sporulation protein [Polynucleobacter paneuropaeus]